MDLRCRGPAQQALERERERGGGGGGTIEVRIGYIAQKKTTYEG